MELIELVEQDTSKGVIRFKQSGIRANLMSSRAWASMKAKMFQAFGSGAASILFGVGQFYGSETWGSMRGMLEQPFDIFKYAVDFGLSSGWGKITTEFSQDTLTAKVENCCFCEGIKMDIPVCYEFAGIMSEALTSLAKEQITVREIQCIAKGNPFCMFQASITKSLREGLRSKK